MDIEYSCGFFVVIYFGGGLFVYFLWELCEVVAMCFGYLQVSQQREKREGRMCSLHIIWSVPRAACSPAGLSHLWASQSYFGVPVKMLFVRLFLMLYSSLSLSEAVPSVCMMHTWGCPSKPACSSPPFPCSDLKLPLFRSGS